MSNPGFVNDLGAHKGYVRHRPNCHYISGSIRTRSVVASLVGARPLLCCALDQLRIDSACLLELLFQFTKPTLLPLAIGLVYDVHAPIGRITIRIVRLFKIARNGGEYFPAVIERSPY